MGLSLKEYRTITDLANLICGFLPGSGSSNWRGHVSFKTIANDVGIGDYWQSGSKTPMIISLLSKTLEFKRDRFEPLILAIVRSGLLYREKQGFPVKADEIEKLNGLILELGFKFPDLWDQNFLNSLKFEGTTRAKENVKRVKNQERLATNLRVERTKELEQLKQSFYALHDESNRQKVGFELEKILNNLFALHGLEPRESFKIVGEQIDGSFELDHEIYLVEAKWKQDPCCEADLLVFRGKIEGKSRYTRGVFISINGISEEAKYAIIQGKQPSFFIIDGYDLTMLLENNIELIDFLRRRQRILAEEGRIVVLFNELQKN